MKPSGPVTVHPINWRYCSETTQRCLRLLSVDERARAAALALRKRHQFVQARAALRALLAETIRVAPRDVPILVGTSGKPSIGNAGKLEISISHTDDVLLIALAEGRRIGVDVERIQDFAQIDALTERWFGASDATTVVTTPRNERPALFYELWTCAEAYSKALGIGLSLDFSSLGPFLGSESLQSDETWQIDRLDLRPELAAAVVYSGSRNAVDVLAWSTVEEVLERVRRRRPDD